MKTIYDIIRGPLLTEKAVSLKENESKVLIEVNPDANKHEIRQAMEKIFKTKVKKVATINERGKLKRFGKFAGRTPDRKKAIITLKKGEKLDIIEGL